MIDFLDGASCLACATIAAIFLRHWSSGRDRLLLLFGLAFVVLALNRIGLVLLDDEADTFVYLARALAFGLILAAIVDKNRVRSSVE